MKAFLLAAGFGTRLRPLTNNVPKCLVPIGDKPLLEYWFKVLEKHGISHVLVNLHYLPEIVAQYIDSVRHKFNLNLVTYYEPQLLGSAGTVRANREWIDQDENFLVIYADNFSNVNLTNLVEKHRLYGFPVLTMGLARTDRPNECGIAELDKNHRIITFEEKPEKPASDLANIGIYVANTHLFTYLGSETPCDFGFDVLPKLIGKMYGCLIDDYLIDIGNHERYQQAQKDVSNLSF